MESYGLLSRAASAETRSSGAEVPKPTITIPIMRTGILRHTAVPEAPSTNLSALHTRTASPVRKAARASRNSIKNSYPVISPQARGQTITIIKKQTFKNNVPEMSTPSEGDYSNTSQRTIINPSQYSVHLCVRQPDSLKNTRNCGSISDLFYHFHSGGTSSLCDHFDTLIMHTQLNIPNKPLSVSTTAPARFSEAPVLRHDTAIARVHGSDIRYARLRVRRVLHLRQSE